MEQMMLRPLSAAAIASGLTAAPVAAQDAYTTRIEPRAVYGATVTIEAGVRVYRPLPSELNVIVNPGGTTPLSLGYYGPYPDPRFAPYGRVRSAPYTR
jgi:hypothetical protein